MRITLNAVSKRPALDTVTLTYATGEAVLARAETEQRPTVLGLLASGRMKPGAGTVTLDGDPDAAAIRRVVALVDAPAFSFQGHPEASPGPHDVAPLFDRFVALMQAQ